MENIMKTKSISSNVMDREETTKIISETLEYLSNRLSKSLGPYGCTTIIQDKFLQHFMTKDGYSILKKIFLKEDLPRTIVDIVKNISKNLVRTVGDGSTSSIIISNFLFRELTSLMDKYEIPSKDLVEMLNIASDEISKKIREKSIAITDNNFDVIKNIAMISTNNDYNSGDFLLEIYKKIGRHGYINLELGSNDKDRYEITNGIEVKRGHINFMFANKEDKKTFEEENVAIFMCNDTLTQQDLPMLADLLGDYCLKLQMPLVFVAKGYDSYVKTFLHENKMHSKDKLKFCAIDFAFSNNDSYERFYDLSYSVNCVFYDKLNGENVSKFPLDRLGVCKKVIIDDMNSKFIEGQGNEETINERVEVIKKEMEKLQNINDHIDREEEIEKLRRRLASLQKSMAVIYIGGNSEMEKQTKMFLLEDAVYACQSALENGYVIGGNLIVPFIINKEEFKEELKSKIFSLLYSSKSFMKREEFMESFIDAIYKAFRQSFATVLSNARLRENEVENIVNKCIVSESIFNLKTRDYENMKETQIINSAETDIEIIKACFSIIGLLVTSNQFVSINLVM
jgi:chaperonin GroEL